MKMHLSKEELAALCREHGPTLHLPPGVDGAQMLWAFAGRESSFGARCVPLHEKAYCYGSKYYKTDKVLRDLTEAWGCWSHASYGPWQILFDNAYRLDHTIDPIRLMTDPAVCTVITVAEFNRIMDLQKPPGLREIADAWNSGDWRDAIRPNDYMDAVESFYKTSVMP
jgi:hypothetical protein